MGHLEGILILIFTPLKGHSGPFFALFDLKIIPNSCYVYGYIMQFDNNVCWMR